MDIPTIIAYVRQVTVDWGLMPYIQAGALIVITAISIGAITAWLKSR